MSDRNAAYKRVRTYLSVARDYVIRAEDLAQAGDIRGMDDKLEQVRRLLLSARDGTDVMRLFAYREATSE